MLTVVFLLSCL